MLKLPKNIEYAILALKCLSESENSDCISSKEISERENIPFELLAKILQKLGKAGLVKSEQGIKGGYKLLINSERINLLTIATALGQKVQITNCMFENATLEDCKRMEDCCIRGPLEKIQNKILKLFEDTSLKELIS